MSEFDEKPPEQAPFKPRKKYKREADGEDKDRTTLADAGITSYKLKWPGRNGAPDRMNVDATGLAKAAMYLRQTLHEQGARDMTQELAENSVRLIIGAVIKFVEHKSGTGVSRRQSLAAEQLRAAGLTVEVKKHR